MSPGKQVEYNDIGGQKENPAAAEYTVDQGDTDESTVGIHGVIPLYIGVRASLRTDQQCSDKNADHVAEYGGAKRDKQAPHKFRSVISLVCSDDDKRIDHKEEKV